ncbi:MAG: hypothetical protein KJO49_14280 [Bacteroidia bacterium]|nr:hypothetical protein [Bacteroidia bacterium]NNF83480.1 hypothetical protein [Flavobacteriaceae bacterium]NNK69322.1 hypothetical protein [Flavobacteriaceae bacterium]NNL78976.1 hypothetical protein [Flavobacteriaceae bacterium]
MKILDGIVISCVGLALIIGAAFIFPGTEEELVMFKNHGTLSMFKRLLAFLLPGWFMLFGIRFFIFQLLISKEFVPSTRKLAISSLIYSLIPCILGSLYFYLSGT